MEELKKVRRKGGKKGASVAKKQRQREIQRQRQHNRI